ARKSPDDVPPGIMLTTVEFQVDLDPGLHPVLADIIDWARYDDMPGGAFPRLRIVDWNAFNTALDADKLAECTTVEFTLEEWPASLPRPVLGLSGSGETSSPLRLPFTPTVQAQKQQFEKLKSAMQRLTTKLAATARDQLEKDFSEQRAHY